MFDIKYMFEFFQNPFKILKEKGQDKIRNLNNYNILLEMLLNMFEYEKSEEYRSFSSDYFNTDKYNDGDRAKYKCFNELKIGENIIEVKTFDGIQDSKINVYKIELKEPEQEFLKQEDHSIIWNSISENIKLMITNIYTSYGECEHYDNDGYN